MLFMAVFSYAPERRDEVLKRRAQQGAMVAPGTRLVGEWSYLGWGRVFRLFETDDPGVMAQGAQAWSDLGKIELFPVVETDKLLASLKK